MKRLILFFVLFAFNNLAMGAISPRTFNALNEIQQAISDQPSQEKISTLNSELLELAEDLKGNSLGLALTYQTHAQLKSYEKKEVEAQGFLLKAISLPDLKDDTLLQLKSILAYSFYNEGLYDRAISQLLSIVDKSKDPSANIYALLAASYYSKEAYQDGLPYIVKACQLSENPREGWLQMALTGYYRNKNYEQALYYVNLLVFNYPDKKDYWLQKAGLHQITDDIPKAAITKELAYKKGFVNKESGFVNLAQLLASQGEAFKVATALELALQNKTLEPTKKIYSLLFQSWLQAKEIENAKTVMASSFKLYQDPNDGYTLLQYYIDAEQWQSADQLASDLLKLDLTDKQKGKTYLYQGMARYRLGDKREALKILGKSTAFDNSSSQAKSWMSYIKQMGA